MIRNHTFADLAEQVARTSAALPDVDWNEPDTSAPADIELKSEQPTDLRTLITSPLDLGNLIIPGLPKLEGGTLGPSRWPDIVQAKRLNRAQRYTGKPCKLQYSHGSCGHFDVDGCFRPFGGFMLFEAWCACGRFRYQGEELGRRVAIREHQRWARLGALDVVTFHGPAYTGQEFVITEAHADDTLTMRDVAWGDIRLVRINRAYVEPAGRRWVGATCDCPSYTRRSLDGTCANYHCPTKTH